MAAITYFILGIALLSGINLFVDHSGPWDEAINVLQAIFAFFILSKLFVHIVKPLKRLDHSARSLRYGKFEGTKGKAPALKELVNVQDAMCSLSLNTKNAIEFIKNIQEGKLDIEPDRDNPRETDALSKSLLALRDNLKAVSFNEKERKWSVEGFAKFVEILRTDNDDLQSLANKILSNIVKYLKASQGQLHLVNDNDPHNKFIELYASYAFDRKNGSKVITEIGQGLVGQAYLERQRILLTEIPENYVKTASGLGKAYPRCILIVPLMTNGVVIGILELASFQKFTGFEVDFVEKIGESIAASITKENTACKTKILLRDVQQQQEEMKAQEEEIRQNMEELLAAHEEMSKKEKEIHRLLELSNANEKELEKKLVETEKISINLELENAMFTGLMDVLTDRITIKDRNGIYLRINKTKAEAMRKQGIEDAIGKSDREFFGEEHFQMAITAERTIMDSGIGIFQKEEKAKQPDGSVRWVSNTRVPFKTREGKTLGTLVITRDISKEKEYQEKLEQALTEIDQIKSNKIIDG